MLRFRTAGGVRDLVAGAPWRRRALEAVAALDLPDCWIGASFVRAPVWDALHGHAEPTSLDDIDVVYHDPACLDPTAEAQAEARLRDLMPGLPWSVRNQARMHLRNGDAPYESTADALRHWLETPTAVAVRLGKDGTPELLAPLGLDDLVNLILRPTPCAQAHRVAAFHERVERKGWLGKWPKVRLEWR
jgi:hypothetical protein